jgi:hypothetical protein
VANFEQRYQLFKEKARDAVRVVHWDTFGTVLMKHRPQVWHGYFDRIRELYAQAMPEANPSKIIEYIKKRLRVAGVVFQG